MRVPWAKVYLDKDELNGIKEVIQSTWVSMGPKVKAFEEMLAADVGVKHTIAVNSGTAALDAALKVLKIGPDDEVIVPAFTYIATANSVLYQHAIPVFADIDPKSFNLDPNDVRKKITEKTKCIIPIDYAGQGPDFDALRKLAGENGIYLLEDGAPGLGGSYKGKKLCSFGDLSITSFHVAKIFTTVEGGMIFTDKDEYAATLRSIRSQGEDPKKKYHHPILGHNFRMTDMNASIGIAQFSRKEKVLASRKSAAEYYLSKLSDKEHIQLPHLTNNCEHAWFLFPILIPNRNQVREFLSEKGIETNVSWPMPVYNQEYLKRFKKDECKVAEDICKRVLCLPMYYQITKHELDYVINGLSLGVEQFLKEGKQI